MSFANCTQLFCSLRTPLLYLANRPIFCLRAPYYFICDSRENLLLATPQQLCAPVLSWAKKKTLCIPIFLTAPTLSHFFFLSHVPHSHSPTHSQFSHILVLFTHRLTLFTHSSGNPLTHFGRQKTKNNIHVILTHILTYITHCDLAL